MAEPVCAVCGAPCRPPFRAPPPELAPDLDLRPGEPTRSTLGRWVQTCRKCGASAPDLTDLPPGAAAVVASAEYKALKPAALRWAMLLENAGERQDAAQAVLQAAWAMDDAGGDAAPLRARAAALWGEPDTLQDGLRLVDVRRRAGDGAGAASLAAALLARPDITGTDEAVLRYQQDRIAAGDTTRHMISSALRPPARQPHVTHQGASGDAPLPKRGFWQRLAGR